MNEAFEGIARWLEQKRRTDQTSAAVISALALGSGGIVFLLTTLLVYAALSIMCGTLGRSVPGIWLAALVLTTGLFGRGMKRWHGGVELRLDPMGFWILKDICSIGPRLLLEGLRQIRYSADLGELNVAACAWALGYLAGQSTAVSWEDLIQHCPHLPSARLRAQLSLLDGVLFLGDDGSRVTLMDPFRLRLRAMLKGEQSAGRGQESARPRPQTPPPTVPLNQPEMLSAYEILGLPPSASVMQIKTAYRKRIKECHPDLFAGMDEQAKALAESWTKALNAAYATLNPRN